jgi:hypothetical protein
LFQIELFNALGFLPVQTRYITPPPQPDCESRKNAALQDARDREQTQKTAREVVGGGD